MTAIHPSQKGFSPIPSNASFFCSRWNGKKIALTILAIATVVVAVVAALSGFGLIPLAIPLIAKVIIVISSAAASGISLYFLRKTNQELHQKANQELEKTHNIIKILDDKFKTHTEELLNYVEHIQHHIDKATLLEIGKSLGELRTEYTKIFIYLSNKNTPDETDIEAFQSLITSFKEKYNKIILCRTETEDNQRVLVQFSKILEKNLTFFLSTLKEDYFPGQEIDIRLSIPEE